MGVYQGECMGYCVEDEPLTLTRCPSCEMPQLYEAQKVGYSSVDNPTT